MKYPINLFYLIITIFLVSCATNRHGIQKHTGFTELPFPSNTFQPGQIVEIYSSPRKVEVTFDPQIPWDMISTSKGWDISADETSNIKSKFESLIAKTLSATLSRRSNRKIQVEFTDTKTRLIPKNRIFAAIEKAIADDPSLKRLLKMYMKDGTHFDVITQTLNATVAFKVVSESDENIIVNSDVIKKLNADYNLDFSRQTGSNRFVSGANLTIGIHYDPQMINLLVK